MKDYLSHARTVIQAARRNTLELVAAAQLLFLLRRPPGPTFDGKHHAGAYSCVAVGVDVLLGLHPTKARQAPSTIALTGLLLQRAAAEEAASLPPPRPWGRWADLQQLEVRSGYVIAQDFCALFKIGAGNPKKGAEQVLTERCESFFRFAPYHKYLERSERAPKFMGAHYEHESQGQKTKGRKLKLNRIWNGLDRTWIDSHEPTRLCELASDRTPNC